MSNAKTIAISQTDRIIENSTNNTPCKSIPSLLLNKIKLKFAALSINSIPITINSVFFLVMTMARPIQNNKALMPSK